MKLKSVTLLLMLLLLTTTIHAHGVDVTADRMVIADENNGVEVKDIADSLGINISVYKFTSEGEVEHQLEHMINNTNKTILITAYQTTAENFIKQHPECENRLLIVNDVNNQTITDALEQLESINTTQLNDETNNTNDSNFIIPLIAGLIIGFIIGLGCGVVLMKRRG